MNHHLLLTKDLWEQSSHVAKIEVSSRSDFVNASSFFDDVYNYNFDSPSENDRNHQNDRNRKMENDFDFLESNRCRTCRPRKSGQTLLRFSRSQIVKLIFGNVS